MAQNLNLARDYNCNALYVYPKICFQVWNTIGYQLTCALYCLLYTIPSLCDIPMLTAGVGVVDSVVEVVHPKCILAVSLSLMNVVVLTTTEKQYRVPH